MIVNIERVQKLLAEGQRRFILHNVTAHAFHAINKTWPGLATFSGNRIMIDLDHNRAIEVSARLDMGFAVNVDAQVFVNAIMRPRRFWVVLGLPVDKLDDPFIPTGNRSTVRQFDEEAAQSECERLATLNPGYIFFKMEATQATQSRGVETVKV